jgi:hypothetical protein
LIRVPISCSLARMRGGKSHLAAALGLAAACPARVNDPTPTPSVHRSNRANFVCSGQGAGSAEQSGPILMARISLAWRRKT